MFALTILYCILFIYIRVQLKNFRAAASTTEHTTSQELRSWQANLEAGVPTDPTSPRQIITKTTVTVMTEDRPSTILSGAQRSRNEADRAHRRMNKVAVTLLIYPIIYICLTMPLSITRLSQFAGNNWGLPAIHAAAAIYCCSGWCNVLLYTATRKGIISWDWLFGKKKKSKISKSDTATASPVYSTHYPGALHPPLKSFSMGPNSKPSAMSLTSLDAPSTHMQPSIKSNIDLHDSDSDSTYEYSGAAMDNDKLVHRPDCPLRYMEAGAERGSNGSTLIGTCSCKTPPRSPAR